MSGMWTPQGKGGGDFIVALGIGLIILLIVIAVIGQWARP